MSQERESVWHDVECWAYTADLPLWRELVASVPTRAGEGCELLELGCGTGRVSLALAGPRCNVTALDASSELVDTLRSRAEVLEIQLEVVVDDARSFELESEFDLIIAPMQLVQLLDRDGRRAMLVRVERHLASGGRAALALLDPEQDWEDSDGPLPLPDMLEENGWVYSSQPVAVQRTSNDSVMEIDRIRRAVSPTGTLEETFCRIQLDLFSPEQIEQDGRRAGLTAETRLRVPATSDHVASTIVVLRG